MPLWIQHLLVLLLVAVCVAVVGRQFVRTFSGRKSTLGSCCAKGCDAAAEPKPQLDHVVFLPSDMLNVSRRSGGR
jgi:hypothetical protein